MFRHRIRRRAFIQAHGDVGAQVFLNANRSLRRQLEKRTVDVRAEYHAVVVQLSIGGETENLVSAAVCENRPGPTHKMVKAAKLGD